MKSVLWRQGEQRGVVYTEDREHLRRLLALEKFPVKREEDAATYKNTRGRVFAWQASFDLTLWNRVVRALGRAEIEIRPEAEAGARRGQSRKASFAPSVPVPITAPPRARPAAAPAAARASRPTSLPKSPAAAAKGARTTASAAPIAVDRGRKSRTPAPREPLPASASTVGRAKVRPNTTAAPGPPATEVTARKAQSPPARTQASPVAGGRLRALVASGFNRPAIDGGGSAKPPGKARPKTDTAEAPSPASAEPTPARNRKPGVATPQPSGRGKAASAVAVTETRADASRQATCRPVPPGTAATLPTASPPPAARARAAAREVAPAAATGRSQPSPKAPAAKSAAAPAARPRRQKALSVTPAPEPLAKKAGAPAARPAAKAPGRSDQSLENPVAAATVTAQRRQKAPDSQPTLALELPPKSIKRAKTPADRPAPRGASRGRS